MRVVHTVVDEPQGVGNYAQGFWKVMPPGLAVALMHGRNAEAWEKPPAGALTLTGTKQSLVTVTASSSNDRCTTYCRHWAFKRFAPRQRPLLYRWNSQCRPIADERI